MVGFSAQFNPGNAGILPAPAAVPGGVSALTVSLNVSANLSGQQKRSGVSSQSDERQVGGLTRFQGGNGLESADGTASSVDSTGLGDAFDFGNGGGGFGFAYQEQQRRKQVQQQDAERAVLDEDPVAATFNLMLGHTIFVAWNVLECFTAPMRNVVFGWMNLFMLPESETLSIGATEQLPRIINPDKQTAMSRQTPTPNAFAAYRLKPQDVKPGVRPDDMWISQNGQRRQQQSSYGNHVSHHPSQGNQPFALGNRVSENNR